MPFEGMAQALERFYVGDLQNRQSNRCTVLSIIARSNSAGRSFVAEQQHSVEIVENSVDRAVAYNVL